MINNLLCELENEECFEMVGGTGVEIAGLVLAVVGTCYAIYDTAKNDAAMAGVRDAYRDMY